MPPKFEFPTGTEPVSSLPLTPSFTELVTVGSVSEEDGQEVRQSVLMHKPDDPRTYPMTSSTYPGFCVPIPTFPLCTINPLVAPPVFKMSPPAFDCPVLLMLSGAEVLLSGGVELGSVNENTNREPNSMAPRKNASRVLGEKMSCNLFSLSLCLRGQ